MTRPAIAADIVPETPPDLLGLKVSWLRHLRAAHLSPKTIRGYDDTVERFDAFLANEGMPRNVADIKPEHCEAFIEDQLERWKPNTAVARYSPLRGFFQWLVDEEEIAQSPMARMRKPKVPEQLVDFPTADELKRVLATCERDYAGRRDAAILRTFISTGCRLAELANLRYTPDAPETNDLDLDSGLVRFMGKGRVERLSHLNPRTVQALDRYLRMRSGHRYVASHWLWLGRKGRLTDSGISQMVKERGQAAGFPLHPHMFRHFFADRSLSQGMNEGHVMALAGWKSREMLSRYAAARRTDRAIEAARRLASGDDL